MLNTYDITIAVNGNRKLDAPGTYLAYYAGSAGGADATITVQGLSSGLRVILAPGQAIRLPAGDKPETSWLLYNKANTATIVGTLLVGDGDFEDHTITGTVSIVDSAKSRTLAGVAFGGFGYQGAVAAQFSRVQLVNANTTKRIIIEQLNIITGQAANSFHLRFGLASLTTLVQTGVGKDTIATSLAQVRTDTTAATSAATGQVLAGSQPASSTVVYVPKTPYILPPSATLTVYGTIANVDLGCTFDYWEENL